MIGFEIVGVGAVIAIITAMTHTWLEHRQIVKAIMDNSDLLAFDFLASFADQIVVDPLRDPELYEAQLWVVIGKWFRSNKHEARRIYREICQTNKRLNRPRSPT